MASKALVLALALLAAPAVLADCTYSTFDPHTLTSIHYSQLGKIRYEEMKSLWMVGAHG